MNATKWTTLTEFVKFLGKEGHCIVDETPKGWFVQYIDRDPEAIARQEAIDKEDARLLDEEDRQADIIRQQIERDRDQAVARGVDLAPTAATDLVRSEEDERVTFSLVPSLRPGLTATMATAHAHAHAAAPVSMGPTTGTADACTAWTAVREATVNGDLTGSGSACVAPAAVDFGALLRASAEREGERLMARAQREGSPAAASVASSSTKRKVRGEWS